MDLRFLILQFFWICGIGRSLDLEECNVALGMETGVIPDDAISASSSFDDLAVGPKNARIRTEINGGAWCPKPQINQESREWLQIDMKSPKLITAIETQGRYGNGHGAEYPPGYKLEYWRSDIKHWVRYKNRNEKEIIPGNQNTRTPVLRELDSPVVATKLRVIPWSEFTRTVCMRIEIYGCKYNDPLKSYSILQGSRTAGLDLRDRSFDGLSESENGMETLYGGLGQLYDGLTGKDDFNLHPFQWIGWKSSLIGRNVEMNFEFKSVRNFSSISFHCNNYFSKGAKIFKKVEIMFSLNGRSFSSRIVEYTHFGDDLFNTSRWVKISIPGRLAMLMRVRVTFESRYLLISEVKFESELAEGNFSDLLWSKESSQEIIPLMFETEDPSKYRTDTVALFTLNDMPPEYIGLIIGIAFAVIAICIIIILIILLRQKRLNQAAAAAAYSSAYGEFNSLRRSQMSSAGDSTNELKNVQVLACLDEAMSSKPISASTSTFMMTMNNMQNSLLEKLPLPNSPPPKRPPPISPPPEYRSQDGNSEDSSEYAEPDTPVKVSAEILPLIPPPPQSQRRRGSLRGTPNRLGTFAVNSRLEKADEDSLHYASSDVAISVSERLIARACTSSKYSLQGVSGNTTYGCLEASRNDGSKTVREIPRHLLQFREKLGEGEFGEVHLCQLRFSIIRNSKDNHSISVAVKVLRHAVESSARQDFEKELNVLAQLRDKNIVQLLGACRQEDPWCMIVEYMEHGDLHQYLQSRSDSLSHGDLIYMATQIGSGMKYLESLNFVHRDLASRNCLVGENLEIKIGDFGMARSLYSADYYRIEGKFVLPIRWMAWESILLGKFTPKTDVWAFGVTLWEILTLGRCQPFAEFTDQEVVDNIQFMHSKGVLQVYLWKPLNCPKEIYDLMLECWRREDCERPSFKEIHLFLQRKNLGYAPELLEMSPFNSQ